jgi:hypothetical protein
MLYYSGLIFPSTTISTTLCGLGALDLKRPFNLAREVLGGFVQGRSGTGRPFDGGWAPPPSGGRALRRLCPQPKILG